MSGPNFGQNFPNTSVNFGSTNDSLDKRWLGALSTRTWGVSGLAGTSSHVRFMARVQRGVVNASNAPVFNTGGYYGSGGQGFSCVYFGPNAPETAFRNRFCFFGQDASGKPLGNTQFDGTVVSSTDAALGNFAGPAGALAARSAPIIDDDPYLVIMEYELVTTSDLWIRVYTQKPGEVSWTAGDVVYTPYRRASFAASEGFLRVGCLGDPTLSPGTQRYWPGQLGGLVFTGQRITQTLARQYSRGVPAEVGFNFGVLRYGDQSAPVFRPLTGPTDLGSDSPIGQYGYDTADAQPYLSWSAGNVGGQGSTLSGGYIATAPNTLANATPAFVWVSENHGVTVRPNKITVEVVTQLLNGPAGTSIKVRLVDANGTNAPIEQTISPTAVLSTPTTTTVDFLAVPAGVYTVEAGATSSSVVYGREFIGRRIFTVVNVGDTLSQGDLTRAANTSVLFSGASTVLQGPVIDSWASSLSTGDSASMAFMARISRSKLTGAAIIGGNDPTSAVVFGTQAHTATTEGICCKYFGPNAPEVGYRNRYCFFARDNAGDMLGSFDVNGTANTGTFRAIRSAPILDDKPRLVFLLVTQTGATTTTCSVETRTVDSVIEAGDTVSGNYSGFLVPATGITLGGFTGASSSDPNNFWYGEISDVMFANLAANSFARSAMVEGDKTYWTSTDPLFYRPLTGPTDLSSGTINDTYPNCAWANTSGSLGSSLTGRTIGTRRYFSIDETRDGRVMRFGNSPIVVSGKYNVNTVSTLFITVRLKSTSSPAVYVRTVPVTGLTSSTWSVSFANGASEVIADGWYTVTASIDSLGTTEQYSCTALNRIGSGHRIWVFGDAVACDMFTVQNSSTPHARTAAVTHTVSQYLGLGQYSLPATTAASNANMTEFSSRLTTLVTRNTSTMPAVEIVWLATRSDKLSNWITNTRMAEGAPSGMFLVSEFAQMFKDESPLCSMFVHAHSFATGPETTADFGAGYRAQLDQLYTTTMPTIVTAVNRVAALGAFRRHPQIPAPGSGGIDISAEVADSIRKSQYDWSQQVTAGITKQFAGWVHDYDAYLPGLASTLWNSYPSTTYSVGAGPLRFAKRIASGIGNVIRPTYDSSSFLQTAQFGTAVKDTIVVRNGTDGLLNIGGSTLTAVEISDNNGLTFVNTGFTTAVSGGKLVITKSSGNWAYAANDTMLVRYAYGLPRGTAAGVDSSVYLEQSWGFLVTNDNFTSFSALSGEAGWPVGPTFTPLIVSQPSGGGGTNGPRNGAATGSGR